MKLYDLLDRDLLIKHVNEGFVSYQSHPILPLGIYNYTHRAQHEPKWGDETIDYCRGLIVDDSENIIARPFKKFHNLNTASIPETMEESLPRTEPMVTKKLDGSLGIYYTYDGFEGIATRGSFTSLQAQWATAWYNKRKIELEINGIMNFNSLYDQKIERNFNSVLPNQKMYWHEPFTPLFEIIYAENRVVIDYDFEGLVLIGMINKESGNEIPWFMLKDVAAANNLRIVECIKSTKLQELKEANKENEEGYVLSFHRFGDPLMIKIKMADYLRLHRIVTGMNPRSIWELLKKGNSILSDFEHYPEPFIRWVQQWGNKLNSEFKELYKAAENIYVNRPFFNGGDQRKYRAECAAYFKQQNRPNLKSIFFMMLDGRGSKDLSDAIWDLIEPRGDDKTFRVEGAE